MKKALRLLLFIVISTSCYAGNDEMMKELNPELFNQDFHLYDQNTSLFCGQLSEIVYWKEAKIEKLYKDVKSFYPQSTLNYEFIDHNQSNTQALLWCNKNFLVIAFRGTQPSRIKDLITDAKFWNYKNNPSQNESLANMPAGHGGFRKSLMNLISDKHLFDQINAIIKKTNPVIEINNFPIYLTGHSLGSGISQLFIECLDYKKYNFSGAYHFAPPLAVDCQENSKMQMKFGKKVYDIVNFKDYIPRAGRNGVAHFGKFYRICDDGLIYREPDAYVRFEKMEYFKVIKYHKLANHLSAIRNPKNILQNIDNRSLGNITFPCMGDNIKEQSPCN